MDIPLSDGIAAEGKFLPQDVGDLVRAAEELAHQVALFAGLTSDHHEGHLSNVTHIDEAGDEEAIEGVEREQVTGYVGAVVNV